MIYSYGNRSFVLSGVSKSNTSLNTWQFYAVLFGGNLLSDILRPNLGNTAYFGYLIAASLVVFDRVLMARYMMKRQFRKPDQPTSVEITDSGNLRLFHGNTEYAEIPAEQIDVISETRVSLLTSGDVLATELSIRPACQGIDHVYILPYLSGYTEFVEKLHSLSPRLSPFKDQLIGVVHPSKRTQVMSAWRQNW